MFRRLLFFVEGIDDERFCQRVLEKRYGDDYDDVSYVQYASLTPSKRRKWLDSARGAGWNYIILGDIDDCPCATEAKARVLASFKTVADDRVAIVKAEIESWYLAGLSEANAKQLGVSLTASTEQSTKENVFLACTGLGSRSDVLLTLLDYHSIRVARRRNSSFDYLIRKFLN